MHVVREHERRQARQDREQDQDREQRFFNQNSYYGIRNVNRVSNYQVLTVVLFVLLVANIFLFYIRLSSISYTKQQERLESIKYNRLYCRIRTEALENENENRQKIRDQIIKS